MVQSKTKLFYISIFHILNLTELSNSSTYNLFTKLPPSGFYFETHMSHFRFLFLHLQHNGSRASSSLTDLEREREVSPTMGIKLYYTTVTASREVSQTLLSRGKKNARLFLWVSFGNKSCGSQWLAP